MSATARWIIALFAGICAVSFAVVALTVPPGVLSKPGMWVMAGFCTLIVLACFPNPMRVIAGRSLGAIVCITYLAYIVDEIGQPLPTWATYRESGTNLINAILGFVVFGIPAGYIAIAGRLPGMGQDTDHDTVIEKDEDEDDEENPGE